MSIARNIAMCAAAGLLFGGCADQQGRVGGVDKTTVRGANGQRLTLVKPGNVTLSRGEAESVMIHLKRENLDNNEIRVSVTNLPSGVEAVDAPRRTNNDEVEVVLRARDNAALVEHHQAMVTAEGPEGIRASETLEITVDDHRS